MTAMIVARGTADALGLDGWVLIDRLPLPAVAAAGLSVPVWHEHLRELSALAGDVAPIVVLFVVLAKAWRVLTSRDGGRIDRDVIEAGVRSAPAHVNGLLSFGRTAARSSRLLVVALAAAFGVLAVWRLFSTRPGAVPTLRGPAAVFPPPLNPSTPSKPAADDAGGVAAPPVLGDNPGEPLHMRIARGYLGVKETPGKLSNPAIVKMFALAGFPRVKDDAVAWCAAGVNACLKQAGLPTTGTLLALSFLHYGQAVLTPRVGDIVVMSRGKKGSGLGHVCFYDGETETHVRGLGFNQSDAVNVQLFPKARVLSYRRPVSLYNSRTMRVGLLAAAGGALTLGVATIPWLEPVIALSDALKQLGAQWPAFGIAGTVLGIGANLAAVYFRADTWRRQGK